MCNVFLIFFVICILDDGGSSSNPPFEKILSIHKRQIPLTGAQLRGSALVPAVKTERTALQGANIGLVAPVQNPLNAGIQPAGNGLGSGGGQGMFGEMKAESGNAPAFPGQPPNACGK